jgi:tetratricopeptide (TPR) repeat protein
MVRFQFGQRYQSAKEVLNALNVPNVPNVLQSRQFFGLLFILLMVGGFISYKISLNSQRTKFFQEGNTLVNNREYDKAIEAYEKVIEIDPNFTEALILQGYAYGQIGQNGKKLDVCKKATQIDNNSYNAWHCLGNAQSALKQYNESIDSLKMAEKLSCESTDKNSFDGCSEVLNSQGESLLRAQKPEDALNAFNKAIEKNDKNYFAWTNIGYLLKKNSPQEACEAFNKALFINKGYERALNGKKSLPDKICPSDISRN